jgi:GNAT superfamily N-acetyltransferase
MEQARAATASDVAILMALSASAQGEVEPQRGGRLLVDSIVTPGVPPAEAWRAAVADADRFVALGTLDEVEVGFATARCDTGGSEPRGIVEIIYVEPSARQVGVGEVMVDAILAWCTERGCRGVDAPALPGSRPAKAFFEEHGFVARLLIMHRALPAAPTGDHD